MKNFWTSLKKRRKIFLFLNIIFLIGIIAGFIYFYKVNDTIVVNLQEELIRTEFNSNIVFHIIFLALISFFALLVVGSFLGLFLYFYEALSVGFVCAAFFSLNGISGLFYVLVYVILFKSVYVYFLSLILVKTFDVSRNIIGYFVLKKESNLKNLAITNFTLIVKYCVVILLYDLFLTLFGNSILSIFSFLI